MVLGTMMPALITIDTFNIPQMLHSAIRTENPSTLLLSGLLLVLLNSIRAFPHYLGAFFIGEAIEFDNFSPLVRLSKAIIAIIIIPTVYFVINCLHHIKYDFGIPAFAIIVLLVVIGNNDYNYVSLWKKTLMIMVFLTAFQFIDIMPSMATMPIGRGESSKDVKIVSQFLQADMALDFFAGLLFILFLVVGTLLLLLIRDENNLLKMNEVKEKAEKMEMENRIKALENRAYMEMKTLVHDLKSPLTSAQALVGVVRLSCERDEKTKEVGYLERVEYSIEKLSSMISEILYENYQSCVTSDEILKSVLSQISIAVYAQNVKSKNLVPHKAIYINKIRIVRAIINLIENSLYAAKDDGVSVKIEVSSQIRDNIKYVAFAVSDNGKGIAKDIIEHIWNTGYSTRSSHGLGLSFVKSVVECARGLIEMESKIDVGTTITLLLPQEGTNE